MLLIDWLGHAHISFPIRTPGDFLMLWGPHAIGDPKHTVTHTHSFSEGEPY